MSGVMELCEEFETRGYVVDYYDTMVCSKHIDNPHIKKYIEDNGVDAECDYCDCNDTAIELATLIEYLGSKITNYYGQLQDIGYRSRSNDYDKGQDPNITSYAGYLEVSEHHVFSLKELFDEINLCIENNELSCDIMKCFKDDDWTSNSPFTPSKTEILDVLWESFKEKNQKAENAFSFNDIVSIEVDYRYGAIDGFNLFEMLNASIEEYKLIRTFDINQPIYRCREFDNCDCSTSFEALTSPPSEYAQNNRMSAKGVSMFYGAFDKRTAEVESSKNKDGVFYGEKVIGEFYPKHALKVLDLSSLPDFDFWMPGDWASVAALREFSQKISSKIIKVDDGCNNAYRPTQKFTEYFKSVFMLDDETKLDGLLFNSSCAKGGVNVVLFYGHEASREVLELMVKVKGGHENQMILQ